jgi:hypothetical protein
MPIQISQVIFTATGTTTISIEDPVASMLIVELYTPILETVPSAVTVSVVDALGDGDIIFEIDGVEVFRIEPDSDGGLDLATIPVPDRLGGVNVLAGMHTLTVRQGISMGEVEFEVLNDADGVPESVGPDAEPVAVPGAVQPNGTLRWVFQDLMPGGLGSWVLPMNPVDMNPPPLVRALTAETTTASEELGGQFHIYEDSFTPVEWAFSGVCPTKEMRENLEAYHALNRRWYLHDHQGRVWKVVFSSLELMPRLTTNWQGEETDEFHDYEAVVLVTERAWKEVS